jgi:hypothetical protein
MKRKNDIKPGAFELILGKESSNRQKWLISLALYGEFGLKRKATEPEIRELMGYHDKIIARVIEEYKTMEMVDGEACLTSENLPPVPMHKWTNYLEHIETIKEKYMDVKRQPQIDYQI